MCARVIRTSRQSPVSLAMETPCARVRVSAGSFVRFWSPEQRGRFHHGSVVLGMLAEEEADEDDVLACSLECQLDGAVMEDEWREACGRDEQMKKVMEGILQGWSVCKAVQCEVYKQIFEELSVVNNMLMRAGVLVVPEGLRYKILTLGHEGHTGMQAMKWRIREKCWRPRLDRDVEHFVRDCLACAISDKSQVTLPSPVEAIELPKKAWSKIAVDLIGPVNLLNGQVEYGTVLFDVYSRWPEFKLFKGKDVLGFSVDSRMRSGIPARDSTEENGWRTVGTAPEVIALLSCPTF
ncbi:hypothetical protein NDU88_007584 [Pleurodeles waltl]|uniref:Gypsy retrotransposon integrase-like protein 1 n=1 Tax=Pleurodeles waltl TaxID=8319 RepID=A0AAV7PRV8_PLEWA|nr:hypothetical protein NDU88_007584 [Pleurodeles waltl]